MQKSEMIYGPPGTGKTTTLISRLTDILDTGQDPHRVGVVSFTRVAAKEIATRAKAQGVRISTLHSLAYKLANLTKEQVVDRDDLKQFSIWCGIPTKGQSQELDEQQPEGDAYLALYAYCRSTMRDDYSDAFLETPCDGTLDKWLYWVSCYEQYKKDYGLLDFSDMLEAAVGEDPGLDHLILDEAQDFSPLQWHLIESWLPHVTGTVILAGDDDQAIFKWSGADPEGMPSFARKHGSKVTLLTQSYRVPPEVHRVADDLIQRVLGRVKKKYKPANHHGVVRYYNSTSFLQMRRWDPNEDVLILVRNWSQRHEVEDYLLKIGVPYRVNGHWPGPLDNQYGIAIKLWLQAFRSFFRYSDAQLGDSQTRALQRVAKPMYKAVLASDPERLIRDGVNWERLIDFRGTDYWYYKSVIDQYGALDVPTKIRIQSIHGTKGAEADIVILINGMGKKTLDGFLEDADSEYRVWYVGLTRARKELHIYAGNNALTELGHS